MSANAVSVEELRGTIYETGEEVNELLSKGVVSSAYAAVILHRLGEVLVVQEEGKPCEGLPGGGIDINDTSLELGAARELFEETPYFIHPSSLEFVCAFFIPDREKKGCAHMKVFFSCPLLEVVAQSGKRVNSQGVPFLPLRFVEVLPRGREIQIIPPKTEIISSHFIALAIWARKYLSALYGKRQ
jgi:ADP-ribose pyrophosphatase YjhB (NUDIX family)